LTTVVFGAAAGGGIHGFEVVGSDLHPEGGLVPGNFIR
jgi:hypothetical protein